MKNKEGEKEKENVKTIEKNKPRVADWRFGPAQLWYDMLDVPKTGEGFDYGFKQNEVIFSVFLFLKTYDIFKDCSYLQVKKPELQESRSNEVPDESFLMVAQISWEDDIIWDDSDETRQKVRANFYLFCKNLTNFCICRTKDQLLKLRYVSDYAKFELQNERRWLAS